jgi:hypothetical protein
MDLRVQRQIKIQACRPGFCRSDDNEIRQPPCLFLLVDFNHCLEVCLPAEEIEWRASPQCSKIPDPYENSAGKNDAWTAFFVVVSTLQKPMAPTSIARVGRTQEGTVNFLTYQATGNGHFHAVDFPT